ncbi:DUF4328 domain-containing protein [Actinomadura hibisca]|uniref:DUF4328 domain-containing protein n=1 Tax=Actinomadura hibisca TaxID=68565 RepID=UPI00082F56F4|nr:DUF4328 domain-containing protein [Actinomadura hibisca]
MTATFPDAPAGDPIPAAPIPRPVRSALVPSVIVSVALAAWSLVVLAEGVTAWLLGGALGTEAAPDRTDIAKALRLYDTLGLLDRLEIGLTVLVWVAMVAWLFRVHTIAADDHEQRWGRPWLVLGWLVPVLNLWVPKQVVEDVWLAGKPGRDRTGKSLLVGLWWISWLLYVLVARFMDAADAGQSLAALRDYAENRVFVAATGAFPVVLAAVVVWKIYGFQQARARRLSSLLA